MLLMVQVRFSTHTATLGLCSSLSGQFFHMLLLQSVYSFKAIFLLFQAYKANVICPNKHQSESEKFHNNRLLESEAYIGGHVECLESGVFRSHLLTSFKLDPSGYQVCHL